MKILTNKILKGADGRQFALDLYIPEGQMPKTGWPLLLFAHGFKGFKDWGHWHQIAETFNENGFAFLKFNFSFNGVRAESPLDFTDLEAFGQNNFSKELADVQAVLNWLSEVASEYAIDMEAITMIGHSRGGPIAILTAAQDARIHSLITWASVQELNYAWQNAEQLAIWKKEGVMYSANARTKQEMPLYYQLYEDFEAHAQAFSVAAALKKMNKKMLILHGSADPAVKVSAANYLYEHAQDAQLELIEGADHVFGGHHPFGDDEALPLHTQELLSHCLRFLRRI